MRTPLHPQVEWQATLRTLDGTQTLEASWLLKGNIRIASDVDLAFLGDHSDKSDLAKDQVGGGIALEKDGERILSEQEERHAGRVNYTPCPFFMSENQKKLLEQN